ncbi:zinc-binding dehydrogenase [Trinickia mobilis]|uniref:zinc-binding dehydrogenase n=1 Tax=Trinickia mobilis TaxID=2816356 RepID=UPI001A90A12F|nr:zinc-binding dehydrogenase [Trinickia mobilis]
MSDDEIAEALGVAVNLNAGAAITYSAHVLDATLGRSVASIRPGGTVALVGGVGGWATEIEIQPVLMRAARLTGILVGSRAMFEDLSRFVTAAKIRPTIDRVFSFDQARQAYAYLESANHFGKVVIKVGD